MATKKVGELIKEARTRAGLSQTALAGMIDGLSASDLGKAERGEKELSQTALKAIAKATGVTQKSLLEAPSGVAAAKKPAATGTAAKKTGSTTAKTGGTTAKKTSSSSAKTSSSSSTAAKKTGSSSAKTGSSSSAAAKKTGSTAAKTGSSTAKTTAEELTSAEKTMLNAYRKADAQTRKAALKLLKGEKDEDILSALLQSFTGGNGGGSALGGGLMELLGNLGKK